MRGMNAKTGRTLTGIAHLIQSIHCLLTTPTGSRIMRREIGSDLANLIDVPNHAATQAQLYAAIATTLMRWEPRLRIHRVLLHSSANLAHSLMLEIEGVSVATGDAFTTQIELQRGTL